MSTCLKHGILGKAPLRLGLAGGGTDVPPYCDEFGGQVLNATISLFARVSIRPKKSEGVTIELVDIGEKLSYTTLPLPMDGPDVLLAGCYNYLRELATQNKDRPCIISSWLDVPPGSGLGSSSTLMVAAVGALSKWFGIEFSKDEIADVAFYIERIFLKFAGGKQDQYAATFGGFNFLEFGPGENVKVDRLNLSPSVINKLESHMIIANLGTSRISSLIIEEQQKNIKQKNEIVFEAMDKLKQYAREMKRGLESGDIEIVGKLLDAGWRFKKKLARSISSREIDLLVEWLLKKGASGVKISGAGGGGFIIISTKPENRFEVVRALKKWNITPWPFSFVFKGVEVFGE